MKRTARKTKPIKITATSIRVLDMPELVRADGGALKVGASGGTGQTC